MAIATVENIPYQIVEKYWNTIDFNIFASYFKNEISENGFNKTLENNILKQENSILNKSSKNFNNVDDFLADLKK
jgi:hypothetical protein